MLFGFFASSEALSVSLKNSLPLHAGVSGEPREKICFENVVLEETRVLFSSQQTLVSSFAPRNVGKCTLVLGALTQV